MTKRLRYTVTFTAERRVEVWAECLPEPANDAVYVQTIASAISAGTEMLVYRNQFPDNTAVDATLDGMTAAFSYPLAYGYAAVGRVSKTGARVFAFQPHTSEFNAPTAALTPIPDDISDEDALFLPNTETAVNLVQDGAPLLGERVLVIGQGVVGLLTTAILSRFPLAELVTLDGLEARRKASVAAGAHHSATPGANPRDDYDLIFELSGNPAALDTAIAHIGYGGRIVVGSWYGRKAAPIDFGGRFHRNRVQIISSQVSTIAPALTGRWTKARRFEVVWDAIRHAHPARWITHRYPISQAAAAYHTLDTDPANVLQAVFTYG